MSETILDVRDGVPFDEAVIQRKTDPVAPNSFTPNDFAGQYPTPLDTTEILPFCEDITVWKVIPEERTGLQAYTWREMSGMSFVTGSNLIAFADGYCPEEFAHTGTSSTITLKNIGAYKALTISDIMHSQTIASANWNGINRLLGGMASGEGLPGASDVGTFLAQGIADLKAKEMRLAATLVLNGWDRLLCVGDAGSRALEFNGIAGWMDNVCTEHDNATSASGTFSALGFDRFLSEACAKPTHIFGHSTAIQELMSAYFQLGFQGSQVINNGSGERIVPGFNFAGSVRTGIGTLTVVADDNFTRADAGGGVFQTTLYALRMVHNGDPLVYKITQIPLAFKDLAEGCTSIQFQIWAKTALIIKACCAHGAYTTQMTGRVSVTSCTKIG
jgi:hypothetical protein